MSIEALGWELQAGFPLLAALQLFPLVIAGALAASGDRSVVATVAIGGAIAELGLAVELYRRFDAVAPAMQLAERLPLIGPFGYHAAVDAVGVLFVLLAAVVGLLVALLATLPGREQGGRHLALLFAAQASVMSQLVTLDLLWFTLVAAAQLVLLGEWLRRAGARPALAAYQRWMTLSTILLGAGVLLLGWEYAVRVGRWSFDLTALSTELPALGLLAPASLLLFAGLAIRVPLFPLSAWLPPMVAHGGAAALLLLGANTALFGLLRFQLPLAQHPELAWDRYALLIGPAGLVFAAIQALRRPTLHARLAYTLLGFSSLWTAAVFALGPAALHAAIVLGANLALAGAVLLFVAAAAPAGTSRARRPLLGVVALLAVAALIGWPGTPAFDAMQRLMQLAAGRFGALPTLFAVAGLLVPVGALLASLARTLLGARPALDRPALVPTLAVLALIATVIGAALQVPAWWAAIEQPLAGVSARYAGQP